MTCHQNVIRTRCEIIFYYTEAKKKQTKQVWIPQVLCWLTITAPVNIHLSFKKDLLLNRLPFLLHLHRMLILNLELVQSSTLFPRLDIALFSPYHFLFPYLNIHQLNLWFHENCHHLYNFLLQKSPRPSWMHLVMLPTHLQEGYLFGEMPCLLQIQKTAVVKYP